MTKPINILCLCFIFFMVGNIGADVPLREQFDRAYDCLSQFFKVGVLRVNPGIDPNKNISTIDAAMEKFYRGYSQANDINDVKREFYVRLNSYGVSMIQDYLNFFKGKDDFEETMEILIRRARRGEDFKIPLKFYFERYTNYRGNVVRFSQSVSAFCDKYRSDPNFQFNTA